MNARTKGFTLVDLLVVIVCVAILVALPACMTEKVVEIDHMAQTVACQNNLAGIGKAIVMSRSEGKTTKYPLLFTTGQPEANIESTHTAGDIAALKTKLVGSEAAMQNVWVLIDKGLISEDAFACPADKDYVARESKGQANRVGWSSSAQFSYGMHFPYKSTTVNGTKVKNRAYLGPQLGGSFVTMADKNPSQNNEPATGVGAGTAPSNHGDLGEAYLMHSGSVRGKKGAADSKVNGDDIYTINPNENLNLATPADLDDQYIVRHPVLPAK
jgi:Tfp pilus assembly major pilin PilA